MAISGETRLCCIIGNPVEHSLSPVMQNAAFEALNLDFVYVALRVRREELRDVIIGVRSLNLFGLNVTMPHKKAILKYLDEISPTARSVGAVNTILNDKGRLMGYNTDGIGAMNALKENGIPPNGKKLLLLGAGGAGKSIAFSAAQKVDELVLLNRTHQKARKLAKALRRVNKNVKDNKLSNEILEEELKDTDILVNATSVGMHPNINKSPVPKSLLHPNLWVMDIIYAPLETKLVKDAKARGANLISGVEMLIYQGAASFEIWTKHQAPVNVMKRSVLDRISWQGVHH